MNKIAIVLALAAMGTAACAQDAHEVRGYYRSNGTYVAPHMQTNADGNAYNNWSSRPNINPYTGRQGTVDPNQAQARMNSYGAPRQSNGSLFGN